MAAVFGPPGPALSRSVVVHDPFDREAFDGILPRAPGLRLLVDGSADPQTRDLAFDLFCSFYQALKVSPRKEFMSGVGRPIRIVDGGEPVKELFA